MDIKITPAPILGRIEGIASKSFAHRALICACLAKGESRIKINTTSADIEATVSCLENLGAKIEKNGDIYTVSPITNAPGSAVINCNESGSTLRFLLPVVAALGIETEINASGRLPERPLSPLKEELIRMGADIKVDGRIAIVQGVEALEGTNVVAKELRGGAALVVAALSADGITEIDNVRYIDRGYETIEKYLSACGANIKRKE